jgi:hypothetical protein
MLAVRLNSTCRSNGVADAKELASDRIQVCRSGSARVRLRCARITRRSPGQFRK